MNYSAIQCTCRFICKEHFISCTFFISSPFSYSVDLRELEAKLKAGYMNRERAAQLAEKTVMELDRQVRNCDAKLTLL